jgi:hypothetical protein
VTTVDPPSSAPAPTSTPAGRRSRRGRESSPVRRWVRVVVIVIVVLIGVNLVLSALNAQSGESARSGPAGSSYTTTANGIAAYLELLGGYGRSPVRSRADQLGDGLDVRDAAILWSAPGGSVSTSSAKRLLHFVEGGGQLVVGVGNSYGFLSTITGEALDREPVLGRTFVAQPGELEIQQVRNVQTAGGYVFVNPHAPVLVGTTSAALAVLYKIGAGRVVVVADPSVFENRLLAAADNARFSLAVLGRVERQAVFLERVHGFAHEGEGLDAIPTGWKIALAGLLLAVLLCVLSRGRRIGPPEDQGRAAAPARDSYVRALATTLEKARRPDAAFEPTYARRNRPPRN